MDLMRPISGETPEERLKRLKLLKGHRLTNEPHRFYTPIGKGEEFINLIGTGDYITTLLSAANGVGKTYLAANLLSNMFWPVNNPFFRHELFNKFPYPKSGRIVSDTTTITDTIIPTLRRVFPKGRYDADKYETTKDGKRYDYHWVTDTGWDFNLMTYEQDVRQFESATLGWAWFDEPPPEDIYKATIARFRQGGFCFITATPLTGSAWMYDEIIANENNDDQYRAWITAEVEDACIEHGVRGFLEHEQILKQIAQYSEEDKQARIFGRFQHLTGLVFKKFNRQIHIVKPFSVNRRDYSVLHLLDPHPRNPDAVMWVATDKYGRKFVIDEIYDNFGSTGELAAAMHAKDALYRVEEWRADPIAWVQDQHRGGRSLADELLELGFDYVPASKDRQQGIRLINDGLDYQLTVRDDVEHMIRPPLLYVSSLCARTIYEFEHWQYHEWTGKTAYGKSKSERPQDKDDHMMENLGRAFIDDIGFIPYRPPREPQGNNPLGHYDNRGNTGGVPNLDPYN